MPYRLFLARDEFTTTKLLSDSAGAAGLQHFRHYLIGAAVILRTFKSPEGILARWIETLAEFDYTVEHRAGRLHSNANGLSRPFCTQCYDRPSHIPWVDEMERADAAARPW